ncbi:MAG: UDP-N-acetylmuramoyl-tripeptide--D-alanyl-D-alanine ligase, partial [Peptostreptococcus sp.]|nr:UDP-N-acetylmuramoyl-tripeptide--D-alanyl-D-alanine ligase [Peptostreptococcus sp.]
IIGENTDGHKYIKSAYDLGCRTFMVSQELDILDQLDGSSIVCVDNTELAMGQLAKYYKNKFDIPVVGITGSVGKTTTRDMVYAVVSNKFRTLKNEKNLNNQFGVPLTIFNLDSSYECAVIEMGMSGFGEIDYLADIVRPDIAVISNIGTSHIEHLGSQEGIFKAKMEISDYFSEDSCLIVNGDDEYLSKLRAEKDAISYSLCSFGKDWKNTIVLKSIENLDNKTNFVVKIEDKEEEFSIPTVGEHNVYNAMSAILVGLRLGMNIDEIRQGLMNFVATGDRQNIINTGKYLVINDVYNASPDSMIASLKVLALNKDRRKVAILGDCLEMGDYEEASRLQQIAKVKMEEVQQCYVNYRKNVF